MNELKLNIPIMWTIGEAAKETGLSIHFIRKMVIDDNIKYVKAGSKTLINAESLCDYLNCKTAE